MEIMNKIFLSILIIGGINWGLIGFFGFDLVAWLFGGQGALLSRIIYAAVGISGLYTFTFYAAKPMQDTRRA